MTQWAACQHRYLLLAPFCILLTFLTYLVFFSFFKFTSIRIHQVFFTSSKSFLVLSLFWWLLKFSSFSLIYFFLFFRSCIFIPLVLILSSHYFTYQYINLLNLSLCFTFITIRILQMSSSDSCLLTFPFRSLRVFFVSSVTLFICPFFVPVFIFYSLCTDISLVFSVLATCAISITFTLYWSFVSKHINIIFNTFQYLVALRVLPICYQFFEPISTCWIHFNFNSYSLRWN